MTGPIENAVFWLPAAFALGLLIGSFLNVVIYRGPRLWGLVEGDPRGGLAVPGSYCPACKAPIPWTGLAPIVSYLAQSGRCRSCHAKIALRYPLVEALGGGVALASVAVFGVTWAALGSAVFGWALLALAFIDLETGYLPDAITLPLIGVGVLAGAFNLMVPLGESIIGAGAGYLAFRLIGIAYEKMRGRDGLGQGDAKLLAAIGAFGGWAILPAVVFAGALMTLAAIGAGALRGKEAPMDQPIAFGPGLCAAGFLVLILGRCVFNAL
ncbi:MAG: A24 family peptidase [Pseudomonadota bacterium]